ncbi:MAG: DUF6620 family protein [Myxococcaceae bacterium]
MNQAERQKAIKQFIAEVDWEAYDYTKARGANMKFPDFTEAEMATKEPWPAKHFNKTSEWNCVHVADLNQIQEGAERRLFALYGVPVEWPRKEDDPDALYELLDGLDTDRSDGGEAWVEAMDTHGLVNDEHYQWVRGRSLGFPEALQDYEKAKQAIVLIDAALASGEGVEELFTDYCFRDEQHYAYFKKRVQKAKQKAWSAVNAVLEQTHKKLDERLEKNKAALSNELGPYKGVSLEDWALANAKLAQGGALEGLLKAMRIERPLWDEVNAEWNGRMSRDTTATIATVYGQAFTGAGQGQFGAAGKGVAASMKAGSGKDVKSGEPISFEAWVKIQAHMTAASAQGVDPNALLKQYKMTAADWGTAGGYWALKMGSNPMEYLEKFQVLSAKYAQAFATGQAGSDIDF